MPRTPRLQLAGGTFHVTARGNRRQQIFLDAQDHVGFLSLLDELARRRGWRAYGYCLMPNHYHLVVETPSPDLSIGMQWLNGRFAQAFNHRHAHDGHLFQGRFHSLLVESDWHLLELSRYLSRNPVRARLCKHPREWPWSSYAAVAGLERPRACLVPDRILAPFGRTPAAARRRFEEFVNDRGQVLAGHVRGLTPDMAGLAADLGAWEAVG
jgi:REP-associated tyrosine transposase